MPGNHAYFALKLNLKIIIFYLIINVLITRMIIMSGDLSMTLFNYTVCPKNMDTPE